VFGCAEEATRRSLPVIGDQNRISRMNIKLTTSADHDCKEEKAESEEEGKEKTNGEEVFL
jgi:hypothetical protein